jgi:hypothetical protein
MLFSLAVVGCLMAGPATVSAHDAYDDSESHPLRLVAYAVHPIGYAVEWLAMRPLHFLHSQRQLEKIFGHVAHENPYGGYEPYVPGRADDLN